MTFIKIGDRIINTAHIIDVLVYDKEISITTTEYGQNRLTLRGTEATAFLVALEDIEVVYDAYTRSPMEGNLERIK